MKILLRRLRLLWRLARDGKWKFFRALLRTSWRGLTIWHCPQCGVYKGPRLHTLCCSCALDNLWAAIQDVEDVVSEESGVQS